MPYREALVISALPSPNNCWIKKNRYSFGHSSDKQKEWKDKGAAYEVADVQDSEKLHKLFAQAERLFILNPPADPAGCRTGRT